MPKPGEILRPESLTSDGVGPFIVADIVSIELLQTSQRLIDSNRWAQVTANEPSPTAKPTRLVDPDRISPAASLPGTVVSSGQASRPPRGRDPDRTTSVPVNT